MVKRYKTVYSNSILFVYVYFLAYMQFLAARSLWTNFFCAKYFIPSAISKQNRFRAAKSGPCVE